MINNTLVEEAAKSLLEKDNILIICHKNPDGDTIGSAAGLMNALLDLGKTTAVLCNDEFSPRYEYMQIEIFSGQFVPEFVVSVDVASPNLFGEKTLPYSNQVDLCIDHHPSNTNYAKMVCCQPECASTTQLILKVVEAMEVFVTPLIANCLYTGLLTDTGCFKFSSTTPDTLMAGAKLMQAGAEHIKLVNMFFMSKSFKTVKLEKYVLNNLEMFYDDRCAVIVMDEEILSKVKPAPTDIEGISGMPRTIEGVDVGVTIRQVNEDAYKISIRTSEMADACKIAEGLGGGGHKRAAGCEVVGCLDSVKKAILKEVETALCN